jgi:hypothetical protein
MPNLDGGHYFLTVLAPIRTDSVPIGDDRWRSHLDLLRETLTLLPTARQNKVTHNAALNSPFARNRLNHLARFVVIDDVVYNGRVPGNTLIDRVLGRNPIIPQPVDKLRCPYLFFSADIDAPADGADALRAYTDALWETMRDELAEIFGHCLGFDGVKDADGFHRYIRRCQLETTMPFNDYWMEPPTLPEIPFKAIGLAVIGAVGATLLAFVLHLLDVGGWSWGLLSLLGLALTVALVVAVYWYLVIRGRKPFPTAPMSDLPSVLKGLYLQQRFTDFIVANQGADPQTLYERFGAFLTDHRPADVQAPTQAPGVISTPATEVQS